MCPVAMLLACSSMNCPRCDHNAEIGQRFCNGCGLRLTADDGSSLLQASPSRTREVGERGSGSGGNAAPADRTSATNPNGGVTHTTTPPSSDTPRSGTVTARGAGNTTGPATNRPPAANNPTVPQARTDGPGLPDSRPTPAPPVDVAAARREPSRDATTRQPTTPAARTMAPPADATSVHYVPPVANRTAVQPAAPATAVVPVTEQGHPVPQWRRFRFSTTSVLGLVVGVLSVAMIFIPILRITTTPAVTVEGDLPYAFRLGDWYLGDLGSNLPMAALIVGVLAISGAAAAGYGWTWGAGLVGGSALSIVGIAAMTVGFAQMPIDGAREFAQIPTDTPFNVLITRDIGYWMLVGTAAFGIIAAFASLNECFADRQRDLNPWIAAVGALAVVATVAGVMLPVDQAVFSDNWFVIQGVGEAPPMLIAGRLVQLGLLGIAGVVGFLLVRPYGLGLAIGGTVPSLWLGLSVLLQPGRGVGPGWRNPGASGVDLHGLTIIGLATLVSMLVLACLSAYNQYATRTGLATQSASPQARRR